MLFLVTSMLDPFEKMKRPFKHTCVAGMVNGMYVRSLATFLTGDYGDVCISKFWSSQSFGIIK